MPNGREVAVTADMPWPRAPDVIGTMIPAVSAHTVLGGVCMAPAAACVHAHVLLRSLTGCH
jgi:hypothetical protein